MIMAATENAEASDFSFVPDDEKEVYAVAEAHNFVKLYQDNPVVRAKEL